MTEFATSNRTSVRRVIEAEWGVVPANPSFEAARFTGESLNFNLEFTRSQEIRADRMTSDVVAVSASASGSLEGELSFGAYDTELGLALFNNWVTTGLTVAAATDIGVTKTIGTPNVWTLDSSTTDFTTRSWVAGQFLKISGFSTAGTFLAQIASVDSANQVTILPMADVATEAAGDSVTITPMNYLRNGVTKRSATYQKVFEDAVPVVYQNFPGTRISTFNITLETGSILNVSFDMLSKDGLMSGSQYAGATIAPAPNNNVMNSVTNVASIVFDGDAGANQYFFQTLELNLDNSLRGQEAVGTLGFIGIAPGSIALTGSAEFYFSSQEIFDRFRTGNAFSMSFALQDQDDNYYVMTIPRAKFTSMNVVAGGLDQDIFAEVEFEGLIDSTGVYQFQISRLAG